MKDYVSSPHTGLTILTPLARSWEISVLANQRKEDSMFGIKPSQKVMQGKAALFHSLFPHVLEIAQPDYTQRDSSVNGVYARCQGLRDRLSTFLWLKRATSTATPMFWRTWRKDPHRAIVQLYEWLFKKPTFRGHQG